MAMTFGVYCEVSGGVTGYRAAWLKDGDGKESTFDSLDAANEEAAQLNSRSRNPYQTASFRYTVRERDR